MEFYELKDRPEHIATVAERIWRVGWAPNGATLAMVGEALVDIGAADGFPFTLVALEGDVFLGTISGIQSDIVARPDLGPCIADFWIEESARAKGVGGALLDKARKRIGDAGFERAYLAAVRTLRPYYERHGWTLTEEDVGPNGVDIFRFDFSGLT